MSTAGEHRTSVVWTASCILVGRMRTTAATKLSPAITRPSHSVSARVSPIAPEASHQVV